MFGSKGIWIQEVYLKENPIKYMVFYENHLIFYTTWDFMVAPRENNG